MRTARVVLASVAALAALTACSDGPAAESAELTWEDSPLNEALGVVWGSGQDPEEMEREEAERMRQVEETVASCMADEGFEYTPVEYDMGTTIVTEDEDWNTEEWAQQYGYGVTTDPWSAQEEEVAEPEEEWVDPNDEYVNGMSASEQEAYFEALYGPQTFEEEEWVEDEEILEEYDWEEAGCQGLATHEVYEEGDPWSDPAFTELFEAMDQLYQDGEKDPRMREVNDEWAACMADAGITGMTTPMAATEQFYEEYDALYQKADAEIDWENLDWEALDAAGGGDPVAEVMEEMGLAELREREIAAAVADFRCQEELDVEARSLEIQFELEKKFIETYQADIDAVVAAYGKDA
ncbi:hypothetical protein [Oceanitalea stevensii]|uniref:Uncharacterized protein n=1 Tax=Oceanitalea stevensii TaxID=2763072 RepID=A0ABR8Z634_9MICO|nr:hypothetical protein [Oceanitalea stevensii]MBD8063714.1 hypothetical protein [Oceanitalea stevensii]